MFCPRCGQVTKDGDKFCESCGNVITVNNPIKPLVTNVGYDDSLPKNSNFAFVLIITFFLIVSCFIFMSSYKSKYDYAVSTDYKSHKFYSPVGYITKVDKKDNSGEYLFIYNDSISYLFDVVNDNYENYIRNDYVVLKRMLDKEGFTNYRINTTTYQDKDIVTARFYIENNEYYFFLYKLNDYDEVVTGFIYSKSEVKSEELNQLYDILVRIV